MIIAMKIWGVTGLIGSGKSTAMAYLKELGYDTLDADQVSRLVVDRKTDLGKEGFGRIYRLFGAGVLDRLGNLDRTKLRKMIMLNPDDRLKLEAAIHPLIKTYIENKMGEWKRGGAELAFVEGTRLIESGVDKMFFGLVLVSCTMDIRAKRLAERDSMDVNELKKMLDLQNEQLMQRCSRVTWTNNASITKMQDQIDQFLLKELPKS